MQYITHLFDNKYQPDAIKSVFSKINNWHFIDFQNFIALLSDKFISQSGKYCGCTLHCVLYFQQV